MNNTSQINKIFGSLLAFALFMTGCTEKRESRLSDADNLAIFAISDFGNVEDTSGFEVPAKASVRSQNSASYKAFSEKTKVVLDADSSDIPEKMRFMFTDLEISGQENTNMKIAFGVDSKFVTAYKVTNDYNSLSDFEKQFALSSMEIRTAIEMQKTSSKEDLKVLSKKITTAAANRKSSLERKAAMTVMVPLFKFPVLAKGILERVKNELREETSNLTLRETEFSKATHIRLALTSDDRKDIGSAEQADLLDQLYKNESFDGKVLTSGELQSRLGFSMKFIPDQSKVYTKLDAIDLKVYEVTKVEALAEDELRRFKTGNANGEIISCNDIPELKGDSNCVVRLAASLPIKYKNLRLNAADNKNNTSNQIVFDDVPKSQSRGIFEVTRNSAAVRARPSGLFDPLNTIKVSDLKGPFYFRRTFEDASNMISFGYVGFSGDMSVINFELENDRLVVRNQKALIGYTGQVAKDREELMSLPVKYFKLATEDEAGSKLQSAQLIPAKKEDAEYLEVDLSKSTIPITNSPLAFFDAGACIKAVGSQNVANMDMRLKTDGMLNFSIMGSYTADYGCHSSSTTGDQFTFNISERVSFKRATDKVEFTQFAPNWSPAFQNSLNFNIFTLVDSLTGNNVLPGREGSRAYKPTIHDFRNGKTLTYWVGGINKDTPADRRALIIEVAQEAVAEWNAIFHKVFKGTENERSGDYIVLKIEDESNQGHLGDLDRNYLWFMDMVTENGLLGVAQSAPNPYSGTNVANNVIIYSGNTEKSVVSMLDMHKQGREYEKLLEQAKASALEELKKTISQENAQANQGAAPASKALSDASTSTQKATEKAKNLKDVLERLLLSAGPEKTQKNSKKAFAQARQLRNMIPDLRGLRGEASDVQFSSNKAFTKNVLDQAFSLEYKDDPVMIQALIAKELLRTEPGLSTEVRELLSKKASLNTMNAKFEAEARKRGTCFMRERGEYNDKFVSQDFRTSFKKELLLTLSHEMGHALGLNHNFKATYDKENFDFPGEHTDRNYSSVMDYQGSSEMNYQGPGPYDLHALRAIYTGRIEAHKDAKIVGNHIETKGGTIEVNQGLIKIADLPKAMNFKYLSEMTKKTVRATNLIKNYAQCWDYQVGQVNACARYDNGASATEIVQNEIQDYNRAYNRIYVAGNRLRFGWEEKVNAIWSAYRSFSAIRSVLDDLFIMLITEDFASREEIADYINAVQVGYNFFHNVIRAPVTNLPHGTTLEEVKARLIPVQYKYQVTTQDSSGKTKTEERQDIQILEARSMYDDMVSADHYSSFGVNYDKAFAIQFLLTAKPLLRADDSQTGFISYNEFERYFKGVKTPNSSPNLMTMFDILNNQLKVGFVGPDQNLVTYSDQIKPSMLMLDTATVSVIAGTNSFKTMEFNFNAEAFKVATIKSGRVLTDRPSVTRLGESSKSQTAIRFAPLDNSVASAIIIRDAQKRAVLLENKELLRKQMMTLLAGDSALTKKLTELMNTEAYKGQSAADIVKIDPVIRKMAEDNKKIAEDLVVTLNQLNAAGALVSAEEIKENPNASIANQVALARTMMTKTNANLNLIVSLVQTTPIEDLKVVLGNLRKVKSTNDSLAASSPLLALTEELLHESVGDVSTQTKSGGVLTVKTLMSLIVEPAALTNAQNNALYVLEDLAKYTKYFNSEYEQ